MGKPMEDPQFKYVTLRKYGDKILYKGGKKEGFCSNWKVIAPPRDRRNDERNYYTSSYDAIDAGWWESRDADEWLIEEAHTWADEVGGRLIYDKDTIETYLSGRAFEKTVQIEKFKLD